MTKSLPSLALKMSHDGIALHQLAFDGHWHELARVALNNAALRERLSNMRSIATKMEGRRFKTGVWLPEEQILLQDLSLTGVDENARPAKARAEFAAKFGGKPRDYAVQIGKPTDAGTYSVAAVRVKTMIEARTFAKSHGFRAKGYSTQNPVKGFSQAPVFEIPADRVKVVGLGLVAATTATLVLGGGFAFYKFDPLNLWELPPRVADFAPFQQPNPSIERESPPNVTQVSEALPSLQAAAMVTSNSIPNLLPYLPPRQLTADALETVLQPELPAEDTAPAAPQLTANVSVNWPANIASLSRAGGPDSPPNVGRVNVLDRIADLAQPEFDDRPEAPSGPMATLNRQARPIPVANTAFYLEPLPAMATRLSPDALAEFISRSGLSSEQLSRMASPLLLIESKLVVVTPGLPPILPRLRSGQPIPEQVEPVAPPPEEAIEAPTGPAPLFSILAGAPDRVPPRRPVPPITLPPEEVLPFSLVSGAPDIRPPLRPEASDVAPPEGNEAASSTEPPVETPPEAPVEPEEIEQPVAPIAPEDTTEDQGSPVEETPIADTQAPTDPAEQSGVDSALAAAVNAAIESAQPPAETPQEFALLEGQPDLLPRLRSGATISPQVFANAAPQNLDPATAEANALRPRRRPQAIIDMPAPIDPMISGAAPATSIRPRHRGANFAANTARIVALNANRPRVTAPVVPADPQSVNLPSSASVTRAATIENAINLRQTNLIGIFGSADARTALIRLSGGRMVRVQQGQSFSGWTVVAISNSTVRIRKRNREEILRMPAE